MNFLTQSLSHTAGCGAKPLQNLLAAQAIVQQSMQGPRVIFADQVLMHAAGCGAEATGGLLDQSLLSQMLWQLLHAAGCGAKATARLLDQSLLTQVLLHVTYCGAISDAGQWICRS